MNNKENNCYKKGANLVAEINSLTKRSDSEVTYAERSLEALKSKCLRLVNVLDKYKTKTVESCECGKQGNFDCWTSGSRATYQAIIDRINVSELGPWKTLMDVLAFSIDGAQVLENYRSNCKQNCKKNSDSCCCRAGSISAFKDVITTITGDTYKRTLELYKR